ncbi:LysR substrate-binding domain-containing protein [Paraglaciecola aquimarina]|uniref:LysR substrate-binding domain-containing protein n=1 Tax=Paraglaciecola algarum TaxID=3050085 RepID=A0ABS9D6T1_9ALTE|nr:LysR substrate-binding domain-containing protein [Paraglaciecola sp. G1-23]MCF2948475.1 LysR substrate-binding domain-containing protein [Paraglaciecola sp. G1-23]
MYQSVITLEALQVLDAIDSRGSFASAAEQLNKVPSALSYIVQKLEEQLSVTLFVRQGRRSVLTPAGRHLLTEGRKLLAAVSTITEQTQTISHGWEPKIRIAFDSILDVNQLLPSLKQFLTEHPNIEIDLTEEVLSGAWEVLRDDKVDLLIGAATPDLKPNGTILKSMGFIDNLLVVPRGHELLALERSVINEDLLTYRTIIVHDSAQNGIPWSTNVIEKSRHFYVTSVEHKIQSIKAGLGIGFLPRHRINCHLESGSLIEVPIVSKNSHLELCYAWKVVNKGKGLKRLTEILSEININ